METQSAQLGPILAVFLDLGHGMLKAIIRGVGRLNMPHALERLSPQQWEQVRAATFQRMLLNHIVIDGIPYAVGPAAERAGVIAQRKGSDRYRRDYYGVMMALIIAQLAESYPVALFATYPGVDFQYLSDLEDAIMGDWNFEHDGQERHFRVISARFSPEGMCSWANVVLTPEGYERNAAIMAGHTLFMDIGANTLDMGGVTAGGSIDPGFQISIRDTGISGVLDQFEKAIIGANHDFFRGNMGLRPDRVRDALRTGVFKGGGQELDVSGLAHDAVMPLLNRIARLYQSEAGGPTRWDNILIGGGGGGVLFPWLRDEVLDHPNIILAADNPEEVIYSNVSGMRKIFEALLREGHLDEYTPGDFYGTPNR